MVSTIHDHTDPPNSQTYLSVITDVTGYPETDADDPGILPADAQVWLQHTGGSPTIRCYKELTGPGSDDRQLENVHGNGTAESGGCQGHRSGSWTFGKNCRNDSFLSAAGTHGSKRPFQCIHLYNQRQSKANDRNRQERRIE